MEILKFLQLGGSIIAPLIILSIIAVTLIIDLIWVNIKSNISLNALNKKENLKSSNDPVAKAILNEKSPDEKINILNFELQKVERKTSFLSVIASISPLLGLLGTVFGMIKIFNVVSVQKPSNPLEALSGGISEALFATAGGLIVAIIAGFAHYFLISSLDSISDKATLYIEKLRK
ncbi:MAG: MotA/TolQ/ExbB proton channel family protein [Candidatus Sericytochromatia bacterium]|nr:MotA/TolQ/ExbB proton channel family protein [Candidatus Sericytochromatia bacterium]